MKSVPVTCKFKVLVVTMVAIENFISYVQIAGTV